MNEDAPQKNENGVAGKPTYTTVNANGHVYNSFTATNIHNTPQSPDEASSAAELHKDQQLPNLRTYESDIAEAVKHKDVSVVTIAIAQKKKEPERKVIDKKKNAYLFTLSLILIVGSAMAFVIVWFFNSHLQALKTTINVDPTPSFISSETTREVNVKPDDPLIDILIKERDQVKVNRNNLVRITMYESTSTPFKTLMNASTFVTKLQTTIPLWLVRSLKPEFMFGFYMGTRAEPFVILKTDSYENAFSGMLKWEETLRDDKNIQTLFYIPEIQALNETVYQDIIVRNKDVRVLSNGDKNPIIMYSLPDKQTIVITTTIDALKEILSRLSSAKFVQ